MIYPQYNEDKPTEGPRHSTSHRALYDVALYRFRKTRAGSVPAGVFGGRRPHGVLVTDRYTGYDRPWRGDRQYCHAHILRKFLRLLKKEPDNRAEPLCQPSEFLHPAVQ